MRTDNANQAWQSRLRGSQDSQKELEKPKKVVSESFECGAIGRAITLEAFPQMQLERFSTRIAGTRPYHCAPDFNDWSKYSTVSLFLLVIIR
jgi:hypothetical protein